MDDPAATRAALLARDGDQAAADEFVRLTQDQMWRLLVHLAERAVACDLAQETYERAFRSLPRYRAVAPARPWLLAIARRVAADHLRRRARRSAGPGVISDSDEPVGRPGSVTSPRRSRCRPPSTRWPLSAARRSC